MRVLLIVLYQKRLFGIMTDQCSAEESACVDESSNDQSIFLLKTHQDDDIYRNLASETLSIFTYVFVLFRRCFIFL